MSPSGGIGILKGKRFGLECDMVKLRNEMIQVEDWGFVRVGMAEE